ncbi:MAG: YiiX/YebB-like N1pC/P60 family cysteine hydrolase [Myxococcaceae bacterium]
MTRAIRWLGALLGRYLSRTVRTESASPPTAPEALLATLKPGDVLLVDGNTRFSVAIKYLTQSTWSHAALFVGDTFGDLAGGRANPRTFIEADVVEGVRAVPLAEYAGLHTRICRPVGLTTLEIQAVIGAAKARLGNTYDLKNVFDLLRYLLPTPPVPVRWRRRLLAFGSGDPTRAICSTLVAQAFQAVRYPILPIVERLRDQPGCEECVSEVLRVRHHSLFVPRDFDVSPFFQIVKPTLALGFDPHHVHWA